MNKIAIIGSGGAGKSTLAQTLGQMLNIPVYHLDAIFWQPEWQPMKREQFIEEQQEIITQDRWIIDGNYGSTIDKRMNEADTVIFLHYATSRCLYRIVKRRLHYHGKTRPDMGKDCEEKLDWEFFNWVRRFNKANAPQLKQKLQALDNTDVFVFKKPKELALFLSQVKENI